MEFDLNELDQYDNDLDQLSDEEYVDLDEDERKEKKRKKKKSARKSIYDVYEPSELEKSHLTDRDNEIKLRDIPERFQLRSVPVKLVTELELDDEAEWIYKQAFMQVPISQQNLPVCFIASFCNGCHINVKKGKCLWNPKPIHIFLL